MMFPLTPKAQAAMVAAEQEARRLGHQVIGTEHLLLGLLSLGEGLATNTFKQMGLTAEQVSEAVEKLVGKGLEGADVKGYSARVKKVLELALFEARSNGMPAIDADHLFVGLTREGTGVAAKILESMGFTQSMLQGGMGKPGASSSATGKAKTASATPTLDSFGRDLTALAQQGKLDPVVGRDKEIERVIQILSRRTKNNPVLIGTKYRGEFEERFKKVMDEIHQAGNVIIFIDELHTLIGAGGAEGAIDAANILKPALARGELQCIGATTLDEYRKYIEKDAALERRFQPIIVSEPSREEALEILRGLRDRYEAHHRVKITDLFLTDLFQTASCLIRLSILLMRLLVGYACKLIPRHRT